MAGHRHTTSDTQKDVDARATPTTKGTDTAALPAMTSTDPVCGMEVDESRAQHRVEHLGKTYYFCAPGCKKSFEADPAKYLAKLPQAA